MSLDKSLFPVVNPVWFSTIRAVLKPFKQNNFVVALTLVNCGLKKSPCLELRHLMQNNFVAIFTISELQFISSHPPRP